MAVRLLVLTAFLAALGGLAAVVVAGRAGGQTPPTEPGSTAETAAPTATEPVPPAAPPARWSSRARGIAVSHPAGWSLREDADHVCFVLSGDGAEVRVAELFGAAARVRTVDGSGILARRGRTLSVAVTLLPGATPEAAAAAADVVESIDLAASGRCRPSAAELIRWRDSRPVGLPYAGRLVRGVRLPAEGRHFFTWDPVLRRTPDRPWRRWGADGVVRATLAIVEAYAAAHPEAPRVGIGDLSRPRGGDFGPKHVSHQNGLDVDVYYPRKDGRERPPRTASQVDRRLAQDLVDRFVAAGATKVFVGPNVGLTGPRRVVQRLANHDNHLHARFPARRG